MSLIQSARMNGHDPYAYLKDVLSRLPTHKASRIGELLPHRWQPGLFSGSSAVLFACPATDDFFRSRIDHMIDLRHPLAVLASRMPWQEIEARVAQVFSRKGRAGVAMPDLDLFGEQVQRAAVSSNAGRPRVPLRIMIALLYLKHAFNESDEGVVERWGETPDLAVLLGPGVL
jgi:hypothetical protein